MLVASASKSSHLEDGAADCVAAALGMPHNNVHYGKVNFILNLLNQRLTMS